ncbi:MAG: hypothetical protein H3C43_00095 [Leptonema sp. (in: Bacteria)]|nr:hypothetical protein [Leptonema sp. (in: bacteria)]
MSIQALFTTQIISQQADQYLQFYYFTNFQGQVDNDSQGLTGLEPYKRYLERETNLCNKQSQCVFSIHQGQLVSQNPHYKYTEAEQIEKINESKIFSLIAEQTTTPTRVRLGKLQILFLSIADCNVDTWQQAYQMNADADLFAVFVPHQSCLKPEPPKNQYHSLMDPYETVLSRTLYLHPDKQFRFFRDWRGSYHLSTYRFAKLRLHFRGRQLLGVEAKDEKMIENQRSFSIK